MKILYFISFIFLASCNSIKVQEMEMDSTQELLGKVKQIDAKTFRYPIFNTKDSIHTDINEVFFDKQNRILKQIDKYSKFTDETTFNYTNGLLQSTLTKNGKRTLKVNYKYDGRKNVIEYNQWENDSLYFTKTSIYDSQNNPIEQTYSYAKSKQFNSVEKFIYDYKSRAVIIENNVPKNHYLKKYFNKKGFIIMTEFVYTDSNNGNSTSSKIEYDKLGNLTKRTNLNNNGSVKELIECKNIYDEKGNIIVREKYLNEKIMEKTIYDITYW